MVDRNSDHGNAPPAVTAQQQRRINLRRMYASRFGDISNFDGFVPPQFGGADGTARDARIESLLAFDTSFVDRDGAAASMSSAEIHLCKSLYPEGQPAGEFEPHGIWLRSALAKHWAEGSRPWQNLPSVAPTKTVDGTCST